MDKMRLAYIDQLKGLTILLVVIGHVSFFCGGSKGIIYNFIYLFHMPCFFILSGLVIKDLTSNTAKNKINFLIKKINVVLVPFLVWSVLLILFRGATFLQFIYDFMKGGYWYLWVIFQFYFFYILFFSLSNRFNTKKRIIIDIIFFLITYIAIKIGYNFISEPVNVFLGYLHWIIYLPYFMAGVLICKYNLFEKLFTSNFLYVFSFVLLFVIYVFNIDFKFIDFIIAFSMIFILIGFFYKVPANRFTNGLSYIGKYSLSIYLMHYFLLPYLQIQTLIKILEQSNNLIAEALSLSTISVIICFICIFAEHLLARNKYLARLFLGKIYK